MNRDDTLKAVIEKYKLSEPVPPDVRIAMEKSRRKNLTAILKKGIMPAFFISAVVTFFFWIKKFGISLTITKCAAAVSAAMIIGTGVVTAAGIYTAGKIISLVSDNKINTGNINSFPETKPGQSSAREVLHYGVAVQDVVMDNVSDTEISTYTTKMINELRKIKGAGIAININNLDAFHVSDRILSVSIMKLEEKKSFSGTRTIYRVSAKIINSTNSHILMHTSVTAENLEEIPDSLGVLSKRISDRI